MQPIHSRSVDSTDELPFTQISFACAHCERYSVGWFPGASGTHDHNRNDKLLQASPDAKWVPRVGDSVSYEDVPAHIASAASEAHVCASIGAKRSAILMARSVIEASAKEKGILKGDLYKKIDKMAEDKIIRDLIAEAAHGIRDFGNDMAHGDFEVEVTDQDVSETLSLMAVVLSEVFQVDARTKSLRDRFAARKAEQAPKTDP